SVSSRIASVPGAMSDLVTDRDDERDRPTAKGEVRNPTPGEPCPGAADRGSAHSATGPPKPRAAGPLPQLSLSGLLLGSPAEGDREGRASSWRTVPSGGLHRHHFDGDEPVGRPLLQPTWDGRAV